MSDTDTVADTSVIEGTSRETINDALQRAAADLGSVSVPGYEAWRSEDDPTAHVIFAVYGGWERAADAADIEPEFGTGRKSAIDWSQDKIVEVLLDEYGSDLPNVPGYEDDRSETTGLPSFPTLLRYFDSWDHLREVVEENDAESAPPE